MNTTEKGDILENKLFTILQDLLKNDKLYIHKKFSRIYQKKGYFSQKRNKNIVFDVSIESFLPDADEYSLLTIFECKNLGKNVSIDDIEEFSKKLSQVGEHNTKGIMVTRKGFSSTVINFAKAEKIGLLIIKSNEELSWVNFRKDKSKNIKFPDENMPFLASYNNQVFTNLADLLLKLKVIDNYTHHAKFIDIPYRSQQNIQKIIDRMAKYDIYTNNCLDIQKLCEFIKSKYEISFINESLAEGILGKLEFEPFKITIDSNLSEHRYRFTICHEIGHLVLHSSILSKSLDVKQDDISNFILKANSTKSCNIRLEYQANIFANLLLIPIIPLEQEVAIFFSENNIKRGYLYLDNQLINKLTVNKLLKKLSRKFNVSKLAIQYRLNNMNLIKESEHDSINYDFLKKKSFNNKI